MPQSNFPTRRLAAFGALTLIGLAFVGWEPARADAPLTLRSPDGRIVVELKMPAPASGDVPRWSATFRGKTILSECRLSLTLADGGDLFAESHILRAERRSHKERVPVSFGRSDHAEDRFNELRLSLANARRGHATVVFRCYNDGVAFRYRLPEQEGEKSIVIKEEGTSFSLVGNPKAFVQYLENYNTSHEHAVAETAFENISADTLMDMPATFSWDDGTRLAITEAALRHYAGMSLMRPGGDVRSRELVCRLTPRPDGMKVVRDLPLETPWRVAMVGDRIGALLETSILYCLNEPSVIGDSSWIKPGKMTFSWWNGNVYDGKPGEPIMSLPMARKYIDFCARYHVAFHSVICDETDTPWYYQSNKGVVPGPDTDVTRVRSDLDLEAIRRYGVSKGVRLWTWVHQAALRGRVEEAFTAFEKIGWSGMMVDFFDHDDQESVEFAEEILRSAARHHILIHLHGVWKPTGWQRTFPNLMNHEGALNLEYLKWSDRCTPEHNLLLTFTRLLAGPMDYHLGGFRAVPRALFAPHYIAPTVLGTRCHHLAMYVCFDNPQPMLADYPTAYIDQPGFEFLAAVPTWWDETRVLVGDIGQTLVTARRKGKTWYVGGMEAGQPRDLVLPLSFLGKGQFEATIWKDAPDSDAEPNHLVKEPFKASATDVIQVRMAGSGGGFVAQFTPIGR